MKALATLALLMTFIAPAIALAAPTDAPPTAPVLSSPPRVGLQSCPAANDRGSLTAQVSQSDCCKGHKGVCGCRAGKIVCCDNTISPNCTCHGDQGLVD